MRFHVPGIPHTVTNKDFCHCAFTQKVLKLCKMLTNMGHEVFHYGCEGSNPVCTEHINVISNEQRKKSYPDEWHDKQWDFDVHDDCYKTFHANTIIEIERRKRPQNFLLCSWGWGHKPIADGLGKSVLTVESGIGYKDTFAKFRIFETYSWMSYLYGRGGVDAKGNRVPQENGTYFDAVIPNYFDLDDFDYKPDEKEDYFLYLGRLIERKGVHIAVEVIKSIGGHLKLAGQGKLNDIPKTNNETIEHVGFANVEKRRELLSKAKGLLMPTIYIEPFGGVAVEAMLSGTPVISTDWGAFSETVLHGITGYRCRTLDQFTWAAKNIDNISPADCRKWAMNNFSIERISIMYQEYFDMLSTLWDKGWNQENPKRQNLDWLRKDYVVPEITVEEKQLPKKRESQVNPIVQPIENEPEYALDLSWHKQKKEPGISFILRAKNEETTIGSALDSLRQLKIPYEVNVVLNQCTDNTKQEVEDRINQKQPINLHEYPFQLGKTGLENLCTPVKSVHSTIWLLNWMLLKGKHQFTFRWDADFIMTSKLAKELEVVMKSQHDVYNISAIFSDTGRPNTEPYVWSNDLMPRYIRYSLWHLAKFNKPVKISHLLGTIIHDSPLSSMKSYWDTSPWWEIENREETIELRSEIVKKYKSFKESLNGHSVFARASCPESDELALKIQKITGFDTDDIEEVANFIDATG